MPSTNDQPPRAFASDCLRVFSLVLIALLLGIPQRALGETGQVYLVVGSDTALWNTPIGLDVYSHHPHYLQDFYTRSNTPSYQVMDSTWRGQYLDSDQHPIKFTWWVMGGNIYRAGDNLNVPEPGTMVLYLLKKYHGNDIRQFGDQLSLHYHTFLWTDYDGDGIFHWNQPPAFKDCQDDWDQTLAQYLLEEEVFPASFRSGWHFMDADWQQCLNGLIPYCFHDDFGASRAWRTNEPIAGVEDWSRAPLSFVPFHPATNDYQLPGDSAGWNVRSIKMQNLLQADVDSIFSEAAKGIDQVACLWSHLPENFLAMVAKTSVLLAQSSAKYPGVAFHYCTAVEAMQRWQGIADEAPPQLTVLEAGTNGAITLTLQTDKPIFQAAPFVAVRDARRRYANISSLCRPAGLNSWSVSLPVRCENLAKVGIALTDRAGNTATRILRYLPDDRYLDNGDPEYSEIFGTWTSTTNAAWGPDARVAQLSTNDSARVRWSLPVSAPGRYTLAVQVPLFSNTCSNTTFRLLVGSSNACSLNLPSGLRPDQWNFVCSTFLEPGVTNVLEMTVTSTNPGEIYAVADVLCIVPEAPQALPGLEEQPLITQTPRGYLIQLAGEPGSTCTLERTDDLRAGWTRLDSLPIPLTGLLEYLDAAPLAQTGFYRVSRTASAP